jgi:recombination protein RecT
MENGLVQRRLIDCPTVRDMLKTQAANFQIASVAASMIDPGRLVRSVTIAFRQTPLLAECEPFSFLGALMTSASLGLYPNTPLGEAYLVPFRNSKLSKAAGRDVFEITLIIGYRGYVKLARRSGGLISIHADIATESEWKDGEFDFRYGSGQFLNHRAIDPDGEPLFAYAHAQLKDGEAFIVWPYAKVLAHRDRFSKAYQQAKKAAKNPKLTWVLEQTPWVMHERAMVAKTMIRQLASRLDLTVEGESAMQIDENTKLNFARFALDSGLNAGALPEPTDEDDDLVDDQKDKPDPEKKAKSDTKAVAAKQEKMRQAARGKPKAAEKAPDKPAKGKGDKAAESAPENPSPRPAAKSEPPPAGNGELFNPDNGSAKEREKFAGDVVKISSELQEAEDTLAVAAVLGVWDAILRDMQAKFPDLYLEVDEAADARLAEQKGGS